LRVGMGADGGFGVCGSMVRSAASGHGNGSSLNRLQRRGSLNVVGLEALGGWCSVLEEAGCQLVHVALPCFFAGVETKEKRFVGS
jgi:hypothetical protein